MVLLRNENLCVQNKGFKEFKDTSNAKKYHNLDIRTGCRARISFDVKMIFGVFHTLMTHTIMNLQLQNKDVT